AGEIAWVEHFEQQPLPGKDVVDLGQVNDRPVCSRRVDKGGETAHAGYLRLPYGIRIGCYEILTMGKAACILRWIDGHGPNGEVIDLRPFAVGKSVAGHAVGVARCTACGRR